MAYAMHAAFCGTCRQSKADWSDLRRRFGGFGDEPVPESLEERLLADGMKASAVARQTRAYPRRYRMALAAGLAAAILVASLFMFPRMNGNYALAQVARAMAQVRSVHFVGWYTDHDSGQRRKLEGWARGSSQLRFSLEGDMEEYLDGDRLVRVRLSGPDPEAVIQSAKEAEPEFTLNLFQGPAALQALIKRARAEVVNSGARTLPGGRKAIVYEVRARGIRWLIYADPQTRLLMRFEERSGGKPRTVIERFDYDLDIPDSVFEPAIPKGMPVVDLITPPSPEKLEWRREEMSRMNMQRRGVEISNYGEAPYHPGYRFERLGAGGLVVYYLPDENVYRVLGVGRVRGPKGYSRLVEDGDIRLPGEPQIYKILIEDGKPGAYCRTDKIGRGGYEPFRILNVGAGPLTVKFDKARSQFVVQGRARLVPIPEVYVNQVVVSEHEFTDRLMTGTDLDWSGLPPAEAAVSREEVDIIRRAARLVKRDDPNKPNASTWGRIKGAEIQGRRHGSYRRDRDFAIEAAGPARPYIYIVPSDEKYYVVGRARVLVKGQRPQTVKNGVVSFDGKVLSSD